MGFRFSFRQMAFGLGATALVLCIAMSTPVGAQGVGATLSGAVKDPSGAAIANAELSIRNIATNDTRDVKTNDRGFYLSPNLPAGAYEVRASAQGFATTITTFTLTVGAEQALNLTLAVGTITQEVRVTDQAPSVDLVSSAISAVNDAQTIRELPLNGRSWTDLASLQPGVSSVQSDQASFNTRDRTTRGYGNEVSISGARPQQSSYRVDGISVTDNANGSPSSILGGSLGVDAIQEFSVLTNSYPAEYGRSSGGIINAVTKSGTNQFHGDAYEFLRNSVLDARNYFDLNTIPPFKRNQFGASAGGPDFEEQGIHFW